MTDYPECHADGTDPIGYDPKDSVCFNCADKFTCLPHSIHKGLTKAKLTADREVEAVDRRMLSLDGAYERMRQRGILEEAGRPIPKQLQHTFKGLVEGKVSMLTIKREDEALHLYLDDENIGVVATTMSGPKTAWSYILHGEDPSPAYVTWKQLSMALSDKIGQQYEHRAIRLAKEFNHPPGGAKQQKTDVVLFPILANRKARTIRALPPTYPVMRDGRIYPLPRRLDEEKMRERLPSLGERLGTNVELEIGFSLVRKLRNGKVIVTRLVKDGFEYEIPQELATLAEFDSTIQVFSSLSSVAHWADGRLRDGTSYFSLKKSGSTEVWDQKDRLIDKRGGLA